MRVLPMFPTATATSVKAEHGTIPCSPAVVPRPLRFDLLHPDGHALRCCHLSSLLLSPVFERTHNSLEAQGEACEASDSKAEEEEFEPSIPRKIGDAFETARALE